MWGTITWWAGLNWKWRIVVPLHMIALAVVLKLCGYGGYPVWGIGILGFILLLFSGRTSEEKRGY